MIRDPYWWKENPYWGHRMWGHRNMGLFSSIWVSFHQYGSLFINMGLFSFTWVILMWGHRMWGHRMWGHRSHSSVSNYRRLCLPNYLMWSHRSLMWSDRSLMWGHRSRITVGCVCGTIWCEVIGLWCEVIGLIVRSRITVGCVCRMTCCERWGAGVETQKYVRGDIGGWGRVPFNSTPAPHLSLLSSDRSLMWGHQSLMWGDWYLMLGHRSRVTVGCFCQLSCRGDVTHIYDVTRFEVCDGSHFKVRYLESLELSSVVCVNFLAGVTWPIYMTWLISVWVTGVILMWGSRNL